MFKRRKSGSDSGEVPADEVVTDEVVVEEVAGDEQPAAESTSEGPFDIADAPADSLQAQEVENLRISVSKAKGEKCGRCWIYSTDLGSDPAHPDTCPRCTGVLQGL